MRYCLALLSLLVTINSYAAEKLTAINLNFERIPVVDLITFVYGDLFKQNFALDPAIVDKAEKVTVHFIGDVSEERLGAYMRNLMDSVDVTIVKSPGYLLFKPKEKPKADTELFFYRPKFRSVAYLTDVTSKMIEGHFAHQRVIPKAAVPQSVAGQALVAPQNQAAPLADSGTSAESNKDREVDLLVYEGSKKDVAKLRRLLEQVDFAAGEVMVKGVVYEVSTRKSDGTAFGLALNLLGGKIGVVAGLSKNIGNAVTLHNAGTIGIDALASALATDSRFKVVSNPNLRVKSGATARFSAGSDVPVLGAVQLDRNGNAIQSIEYKPSGVILNIKPDVREGQIELTVNQQLSNFVATTTGVNNSPTLLKREISTSIISHDDDVVVLGGLTEEKTTSDRNGLSFLPAFLHSRGDEDGKTEILLMLQVTRL